jgi:hypothetical protein
MSVSNILTKLKEINNSNLISVFVPSANKEMTFRPMSVKQQKDLIKSGLDGALAGVTISNIINDIIISNSTEKYKFLVTDKFPIILSLRKQSFGNIFTLKDDEKETVFDLDTILKRELKYTYPEKVAFTLEGTEVSVYLDLVSLEDDTKINNVQIEKSRKNKDENISETVGSLFIYEIVKFVTKIVIDKDELDLNTLPVKDRLNLIENLPAVLNNNILDYIQKFRKEEAEYITTDAGMLPVDARLFAKD